MKVFIGADHGGYQLKEQIKSWLDGWGYVYEDMGAMHLDPDDDYPDFILPVAVRVAKEKQALGIVIGRSGNGEAIAANKVAGIRAALCMNEKMARKARDSNNANVLALGADYIEENVARKVVKTFLETPFSQKVRHKRRLRKLSKISGN